MNALGLQYQLAHMWDIIGTQLYNADAGFKTMKFLHAVDWMLLNPWQPESNGAVEAQRETQPLRHSPSGPPLSPGPTSYQHCLFS